MSRFLPPAAAPLSWRHFSSGIKGLLGGVEIIDALRQDLQAHYQMNHCFFVSSGKAALYFILKALHQLHPHRNEVLIPAFTCFSVPSAIVRAGLKVRLCDVDPETLDFDFDHLAQILKGDLKTDPSNVPRLLAVIPTHLFGLVADIGRTRNLVSDPEVTVVEDAAQMLLARDDKGLVGRNTDISFFSLGRGKALSAVEGGMILTNRNGLAENLSTIIEGTEINSAGSNFRLPAYALAISLLQNPLVFAIPKSLPFLKLGETIFDPAFYMRKFSSFQAGLISDWFDNIQAQRAYRKKNADFYRSVITFTGICHFSFSDFEMENCVRYPLRIESFSKRANLLKGFQSKKLGIMPTYPSSINYIEELNYHPEQKFPSADKLSKELVTLPVHSYVNAQDRDEMAFLFRELFS